MQNLKNLRAYLYDSDSDSSLQLLCKEKDWDFWSVSEVHKTLQDPHNHLLFLSCDESVDPWVGLVFFSLIGDSLDVIYIYISESFRRQGFGLKLLHEMETWANRKSGKTVSIYFEVRASHKGAMNLYEEFGAQKIDVRKRYYANQEDAFIYQKN